MNAATHATNGALQAFRNISISAFITNPVGAAIIGVSVLVTALAFNVGGLRDAVFGLGETILEFLDHHFKPLADAIRWLVDGIQALTGQVGGELPPAIDTATSATIQYTDETRKATKATENAGIEVETYSEYMQRLALDSLDAWHENLNYLESIGKIDLVQAKTNTQIELAANYLRDVERDAQRAAQENFNLVASQAGLEFALSLTNEQLKLNADALRKAAEEAEAAARKVEEAQRAFERTFGPGVISPEKAIAAGFGDNATIMASANAGRLGGVFVAGKGRVLDRGGTLYENVFGYGTETGTPHLLHKGENVVPPGQGSGVNVHVEIITKDPGTIVSVNGQRFKGRPHRNMNTLVQTY